VTVPGPQIAHAPAQGEPRAGERDGAFLKRAEVRDVLAWMRLLLDPQDAVAVARALARPPIELRQVDLARVIQVARRRKLDLVLGLSAAVESPQVPPEARERIARFLELHHAASAELAELRAERFLARLIELLAPAQRSLLAPEEAAAQSESLARLLELAGEFVRERPWCGTRELALHLAGLSPGGEEELLPDAPAEAPELQLEQLLGELREQLIAGIARIGGRLGELRLDTDLDISHGVVAYLELLKLAALLQRREGQDAAEALADVNVRLLAAATPLQREILETSTLDEALLGLLERGGAAGSAPRPALARTPLAREEHSLVPFLPRKGSGLALSASDIQTYRSCPQRYKYARVLRIPLEQTIHQRFGIAVHQVLERYHAAGASTLEQLLDLLDAVWRRSGLGDSESGPGLYEKARAALTRYHERLATEPAEPVWFERPFSFRLGPHHLRGRVDRVDRLPDGDGPRYELIDYKTSRPKSAEQLEDDVQLSLYALAAREDWALESSRQSYYYVLDDVKVPLARSARDAEALSEIVLEVGEGILGQRFEPTPSRTLCASCDYRVVCPAAAL
jgi:DNA helicase-2/ATP-dependent DNA helicase PcrA